LTDPTDIPLSLDDRLRLHQAVCSDLNLIAQRAGSKLVFSSFLYAHGQFKDAETYGKWAKECADEIPIELLKQESEQLKADMALFADPEKRKEFLNVAMFLHSDGKQPSANMLPLQTRKMMTMLYMGTELKRDGQDIAAEFGKTTGFKPDLAFEMAKETRQKTIEILGFDPLDAKQARQDPEVASLFGGICEIVSNPEKYNLYKLVDDHKLEKMQKELKKYTGIDSMLTDIGVVVLTAGVLAVSRSPKVQAGIESMLGHTLPGVEVNVARLTKIGGLTVAASCAPLARHYGYKAMSGLAESWSDTAVHVVGSLAAAELGGRVLGSGSMLTGSAGRGVTTLRSFDKVGSAEWLTVQGYNTTGKLADLLRTNGFISESKIFANVPRGTALSSEAGLKAIEQANLTNSRLATVAKSVAEDLRSASGIDSSKLADSLGKSSGGKIATVDDIVKIVDQEKLLLEQYLKNANNARKSTSIADSLAQHGYTPERARIEKALEGMGVKNVGEAEKLLKQLEKGVADQFPKIAEMQKSGLVSGSTKLIDLAAMSNRPFDGPGLERLLSRVPGNNRGALLTDKIIDEVASGISKGRTKIQEAVLSNSTAVNLPSVPSHFGVPTPHAVARNNWTTALTAGGAITGTYNSIVKTWDLAHANNPATGQPYSFGEAFREAHFPTILDPNAPAVLRHATSFILGTAGQALAGALMLRPGAIHKGTENGGFRSSMWDALPITQRGLNNWNATVFAKPGMNGAGALTASLYKPMMEDSARHGQQNARYKNLLRNSQTPIENKPLQHK